jgi:hypothetical protein
MPPLVADPPARCRIAQTTMMPPATGTAVHFEVLWRDLSRYA